MIQKKIIPKSRFISDCVVTLILALDLTLRFVAYPSKKHFFYSLVNMTGIITVLVSVLAYFVMGFNLYSHKTLISSVSDYLLVILFSLQGFRAVYLLRTARYYDPLKVILLALKDSHSEFILLVIVLFFGATLFGHIIFAVELQTDSFWSIPDAIWWAVITMTTVGYGDVIPDSVLGKIVGTLCATTGIFLIALPVPIIAKNFVRYHRMSKIINVLYQDRSPVSCSTTCPLDKY